MVGVDVVPQRLSVMPTTICPAGSDRRPWHTPKSFRPSSTPQARYNHLSDRSGSAVTGYCMEPLPSQEEAYRNHATSIILPLISNIASHVLLSNGERMLLHVPIGSRIYSCRPACKPHMENSAISGSATRVPAQLLGYRDRLAIDQVFDCLSSTSAIKLISTISSQSSASHGYDPATKTENGRCDRYGTA